MKNKTHKPGIHENFLVTRRLKLEGLDSALIEPLIAQLGSLPIVDEVAITMKRHRPVLKIAYDASIRTQPLDEVKQVLAKVGAGIANDRWTRFKRSFYETTDQNIYDNARHEPHCCSKAPPGK